jgi:uncharacterized protein YydD (DUF2326 family)
LAETEDVQEGDIRHVYDQVGIYFFSDQVRERFEQVLEFHRRVAENRRAQLSGEQTRVKQRVAERRRRIDLLQRDLQEKLGLLRSGVALERLSRLQSDLNSLEAEMADLRQQIPRLRDVSEAQKRLTREIEEQVDLIGHDVQSREESRKFAVQAFAEISRHLYDEPGSLILGRSKGSAGFEIDTDIVGKKSGGKSHMQIFCFDWVLVEASKRQSKFPGFLVHDSHIFDGVDGAKLVSRLISPIRNVASWECSILSL